jgi:hypothetical protein
MDFFHGRRFRDYPGGLGLVPFEDIAASIMIVITTRLFIGENDLVGLFVFASHFAKDRGKERAFLFLFFIVGRYTALLFYRLLNLRFGM